LADLIVKDPLSGVKGDDLKTINPFSVDRKTALIDINLSIDWMEGRKKKSDKTVLQRMRDGTLGKEEKIPNREPSADSEFDGFDVVLRLAGLELEDGETSEHRKHSHLFAGIQGDDSEVSQNRFLKDTVGSPVISTRVTILCHQIGVNKLTQTTILKICHE